MRTNRLIIVQLTTSVHDIHEHLNISQRFFTCMSDVSVNISFKIFMLVFFKTVQFGF